MKYRMECRFTDCDKIMNITRGTLRHYCCKKHRYLARGSKRGKRLAKKL